MFNEPIARADIVVVTAPITDAAICTGIRNFIERFSKERLMELMDYTRPNQTGDSGLVDIRVEDDSIVLEMQVSENRISYREVFAAQIAGKIIPCINANIGAALNLNEYHCLAVTCSADTNNSYEYGGHYWVRRDLHWQEDVDNNASMVAELIGEDNPESEQNKAQLKEHLLISQEVELLSETGEWLPTRFLVTNALGFSLLEYMQIKYHTECMVSANPGLEIIDVDVDDEGAAFVTIANGTMDDVVKPESLHGYYLNVTVLKDTAKVKTIADQ